MKQIVILFCIPLLLNCTGQPADREFVFTTSDRTLQEVYDWAREMALSYVGDANDPVGPWYEASLPEREAFCMRDVSHQSGAGEILGLSRENYQMFLRFTENISESKDWCSWWEINRYNQPAPVDYRNDKEFWYNLNGNFDVLDACYRTYLWTGDKRYVSDPVFLWFYEKTMSDYIECWQLQPSQIMERARFMNSPEPFNIRDSFHKCRGLPSYVENFEGLTMSADLIASIYRACISYAEIMQLNGQSELSRYYTEMAKQYQDVFETLWWNEEKQSYYTFFTDAGEFHKGEGETFIIWFGITQNPERLRRTFSHLMAEEWNVENYSYFPSILYTYGYHREAYEMMTRLMTIERNEYPEVSYGVIEGLIKGLAGVCAHASFRTISTVSRIGDSKDWVNLEHLPVFGETVSIRHEGTSKSSFSNHTTYPVYWKATFPGKHDTLRIDGKVEKAMIETDLLGNAFSFIMTEIKPGKKSTVSVVR